MQLNTQKEAILGQRQLPGLCRRWFIYCEIEGDKGKGDSGTLVVLWRDKTKCLSQESTTLIS